ncbi:MAG: gliding motility protein GldN [Muribaculaceae bacterium]|nr:gliding motility protein GldN [Muribaculaceae bacterium]
MKYISAIFATLLLAVAAAPLSAQTEGADDNRRSVSTGISRTAVKEASSSSGSSRRALDAPARRRPADDSSLQWMRIVYRFLDLDDAKNATLYYPEDVIDGDRNLFRIIMSEVIDGRIPAFDYLDGREVFTPEFQVAVPDLLDRFRIPSTRAKGSTERNPRYAVEDADIPASEVLGYYIIERWEFDNRSNSTRARVEAICPVLFRTGDFGGEAVRYPMFWVRMSDLQPALASSAIFVDDSNNLQRYTIDDFFTLNMYQGDIYKTRNVRNKSMMELYPDSTARHAASDSIHRSLSEWHKSLWVPSREEVIAAREAREAASADSVKTRVPARSAKKATRSTRSTRKAKVSDGGGKSSSGSSGSAGVTRSVRNRRR